MSTRRASMPTTNKLLLTFVVFSLWSVFGNAQKPDDDDFTVGRTNGRGYLKLDMQARIALLAGIDDGMAFLADEGVIPIATVNRYMVNGFYVSDFAKQVNDFYKDTANIRIPVSYALLYVQRKSKGENPRDLENFLATLRKTWSTR